MLLESPKKTGLTDVDLDKDIQICLTSYDPNLSETNVIFNYKEYEYKKVADPDYLTVLFCQRNKVVLKCDETEKPDTKKDEKARKESGSVEEDASISSDLSSEDTSDISIGEKTKKLSNQFNFSDRATQTLVATYKAKGVQTDPALKVTFSANASQWEIYDFYSTHSAKHENDKKKESDKPVVELQEEPKLIDLGKFRKEINKPDLSTLSKALRVTERMINQNTYDEITQDFKYWEDLSDELKPRSGSLLPLWKFTYQDILEMDVTCIAWNPRYDDMFAISYGSLNFLHQKNGCIAVFSLNDPSYPEFLFPTSSGVLCLDAHPSYFHFIVVGFYDGNVAVFNLETKSKKPMCISDSWRGKHFDPVWQVQWHSNDMDGNLKFYSVGGDGKITEWTLRKNYLQASSILSVWLDDMPFDDAFFSSSPLINDAAVTIHFHPVRKSNYLLGSYAGSIFLCNNTYVQGILMKYEPHKNVVKKIEWNNYDHNIFITCSLDHTVKIWDCREKDPVCVFDLGSPVGDVRWAPYSATVFAAVTADGKAHVYDLLVSKYAPICVQVVVPKKNTTLSCVAFNKRLPIILIGDARGFVRSFKLSPNLRKSLETPVTEKHKGEQMLNLSKCLAAFRDHQVDAGETVLKNGQSST